MLHVARDEQTARGSKAADIVIFAPLPAIEGGFR
jgi:hypothetical protein